MKKGKNFKILKRVFILAFSIYTEKIVRFCDSSCSIFMDKKQKQLSLKIDIYYTLHSMPANVTKRLTVLESSEFLTELKQNFLTENETLKFVQAIIYGCNIIRKTEVIF